MVNKQIQLIHDITSDGQVNAYAYGSICARIAVQLVWLGELADLAEKAGFDVDVASIYSFNVDVGREAYVDPQLQADGKTCLDIRMGALVSATVGDNDDVLVKLADKIFDAHFVYVMYLMKNQINKALEYIGAELIKDTWYWSSTEYSAACAWYQSFNSGVFGSLGIKANECIVRPVSAFNPLTL